MWSTSQSNVGRRDGRVDRNRRRSFNMPIVRAKFTCVALVSRAYRGPDLFLIIQSNRREGRVNFDNTSRWQILQWLTAE